MNEGEPANETIAVPKKDYDEMVEKLANSTQSVTNLTSEIKELREKGKLTADEAEELRTKLKQLEERGGDTQELTPEKVVEEAEKAAKRILSERDKVSAEGNRKAAFAAFIEKHKEFHPDNDAGGIKLSRLEREIQEFNMSGLSSVEDFMTKFEKAKNLVLGTTSTSEEGTNPNPDAPANGGGARPKEKENMELSSQEMKIINETFGGDKERYIKIKLKRPDYVATLLQYAR